MQNSSGSALYIRLISYLKPHALMFAIGIIGFIIFALTQPMMAWLLGQITDAINEQDKQARFIIPAILIGVVLIRGIGTFMGDYGMGRVAYGVIHTLRKELFNHLTVVPNHYFDQSNSGSLISRITFDVLQVTQAITDALRVSIREGATAIFLFAYLLWLDWKITLIFLVIAPLLALIVNKLSSRLRMLSKRIQNSMGDLTHICSEMINNFQIMRIFGAEDYEKKRFNQESLNNFKQNMKFTVTSAVSAPVIQLVVAFALAFIIFLAMTYMQVETAGDFVAYLTAAFLIPKSIRQLAEVINKVQKGIAASESIFSQLDISPEKDIGKIQNINIKGNIKFENVTFNYPGTETPALDNISFQINSGETVALVGRSGSGKTSLINLLPRFYNIDNGLINLDEYNIKDINLSFLRKQISLVNQDIVLFNDTLINNIAYGAMGNASEEQVIEAAKQANAWEFIEKLPKGIHTMVGENGSALSGGQCQRLALARAILKDAPILILDEATSSLDSESERYIQNTLNKLKNKQTILIIAHRLSTIENADRIIVMEEGKIVEQGKHDDLILANNHYANLYRSGFSDMETN